MASQAPTMIQCWLHGKCWEIQQNHNWDAQEYNTQKKENLAKAELTRWCKQVYFHLVLLLALMSMLLMSTATNHFYKI
jgi:hypothetical protein